MGSAIVFDPHPDDADWWTGGLTLLLNDARFDVHYVCVGPAKEETENQALESAEVLGVTRHFRSLECHRFFERPSLPQNTLIRTKTGRAMMLGASVPVEEPVLYAEGYRIIRGHPRKISSLREIFPDKFFYRHPQWLLSM